MEKLKLRVVFRMSERGMGSAESYRRESLEAAAAVIEHFTANRELWLQDDGLPLSESSTPRLFIMWVPRFDHGLPDAYSILTPEDDADAFLDQSNRFLSDVLAQIAKELGYRPE